MAAGEKHVAILVGRLSRRNLDKTRTIDDPAKNRSKIPFLVIFLARASARPQDYARMRSGWLAIPSLVSGYLSRGAGRVECFEWKTSRDLIARAINHARMIRMILLGDR